MGPGGLGGLGGRPPECGAFRGGRWNSALGRRSEAGQALEVPLPSRGIFVHGRRVKASDFFALPASLAPFAAHFPADVPPWEWLKRIGAALATQRFDAPLPPRRAGVHTEGLVFIHPSVKLPSHATIIGPVWIGPKTEIRPGAFVRGNVIVGEG